VHGNQTSELAKYLFDRPSWVPYVLLIGGAVLTMAIFIGLVAWCVNCCKKKQIETQETSDTGISS